MVLEGQRLVSKHLHVSSGFRYHVIHATITTALMSLNRSSLSTIFQALSDCVTALGFDAESMFTRAGLDFSKIYDPDARFRVTEVNKLWRIATAETKHPCLLFEVANYIEPWMLHAVGHAWITSPNLLAALQRFERSHRMLSTNVEIKLVQLQGAWQFSTNVIESMDDTDGVLAGALRMCRMSFGDDLKPLEVHLIRLEPQDASPITDFFNCPVEFGYDENVMVFSSSDLQRKLRGSNPLIAAAMDELINSYLARFDSSDVVSRVREVVVAFLVHGEPDKEIIAEELKLSPRTLQRRLGEQDSSVKKIVDETRHQLSTAYLDQSHLSIKEVAYSLGFNDPSNFSRAFRRWEGMTPKEYRRSHA